MSVGGLDLQAAREGIGAVIFDCDGTLVDSEELGFHVMLQEASRVGVQFSPGEALIALRGKSMASSLAHLAQRLGRPLPANFEAELRKAMAVEFRHRLQPMPGAREVLDLLTVPFCVASNGPREKTELTLTLTGLRPHFADLVFSAYEVGYFKPDPQLFLVAAQALGMPPRRCAVVEDSIPGMAAGLAAGMLVYAVKGDVHLPPEIRDRIVLLDDIRQLADEPWNRARGDHPVS